LKGRGASCSAGDGIQSRLIRKTGMRAIGIATYARGMTDNRFHPGAQCYSGVAVYAPNSLSLSS
jgi:hypothetical protein